jgi:hypothetical protein
MFIFLANPTYLLRNRHPPISTNRLQELSQCGSLPVIYSSYAMTWIAILANAALMLERKFAVQSSTRNLSRGSTQGFISCNENFDGRTLFMG